MRLVIHATNTTYHEFIADERNHGRLPLAWLTFGDINGLGWGFLHPWAQQAIFPHKGTLAGIGDWRRYHEPFLLLRLWPTWCDKRHPNHEHYIEGRYWHGIAWRKGWGWRPRRVLLDYDLITVDEQFRRDSRDGYW